MMIETVVPTWTHSNQRFFGSTALLALIEYYGRLGWGFYGVDVFSAERQLLTVEIAAEHGATWARSLAEK
jgi:hypothetical protein